MRDEEMKERITLG